MKKALCISIILILISFSIVSNAIVTNSSEYSNVKVYVLYNEENEAYNQEKQWLDDNINIRKEYINTNENEELYNKTKEAFNIKKDNLPITIIGTETFKEYNEKTQENIQKTIDDYNNNEDKYVDIIEKIRNNEDVSDYLKKDNSSSILVIFRNIVIVVVVIILILFIIRKYNKSKRKKKSRH